MRIRVLPLFIGVHLCVSVVDLPAADVVVSAADLGLARAAGLRVTLTPSGSQRINTTNLLVRTAKSGTLSAAGLQTFSNVVAGNYTLTIQSVPPTVFTLGVPDTNATLSAAALVDASTEAAISTVLDYVGTNTGVKVAAGTNVVAVTNAGVVTISAAPSGQNIAAGTNVVAVTNAGVVTISASPGASTNLTTLASGSATLGSATVTNTFAAANAEIASATITNINAANAEFASATITNVNGVFAATNLATGTPAAGQIPAYVAATGKFSFSNAPAGTSGETATVTNLMDLDEFWLQLSDYTATNTPNLAPYLPTTNGTAYGLTASGTFSGNGAGLTNLPSLTPPTNGVLRTNSDSITPASGTLTVNGIVVANEYRGPEVGQGELSVRGLITSETNRANYVTASNSLTVGTTSISDLTQKQNSSVYISNLINAANGTGVLSNNGSGSLSWVAVAGGGGGVTASASDASAIYMVNPLGVPFWHRRDVLKYWSDNFISGSTVLPTLGAAGFNGSGYSSATCGNTTRGKRNGFWYMMHYSTNLTSAAPPSYYRVTEALSAILHTNFYYDVELTAQTAMTNAHLRCGILGSTTTTNDGAGIFWELNGNPNTGVTNWVAICMGASTTNCYTNTVAFSIRTWYNLGFYGSTNEVVFTTNGVPCVTNSIVGTMPIGSAVYPGLRLMIGQTNSVANECSIYVDRQSFFEY